MVVGELRAAAAAASERAWGRDWGTNGTRKTESGLDLTHVVLLGLGRGRSRIGKVAQTRELAELD